MYNMQANFEICDALPDAFRPVRAPTVVFGVQRETGVSLPEAFPSAAPDPSDAF